MSVAGLVKGTFIGMKPNMKVKRSQGRVKCGQGRPHLFLYKYGSGFPCFYEICEDGSMKNVEIVWRTLADAALGGQRDWNSIGDIARAASVAPSTTHQALGRLLDIGAVRANSRRGCTVVAPEKLLDAFAAHRNLRADTVVSTTLPAAQTFLDDGEVDYALSGSTAAVHYLGGRNTVADLGRRIIYTTRTVSQADFPPGDEVIILTEDQDAARKWRSGYASLAQTYADLWASPGWQAAEFTRALKTTLFPAADWEQQTSA